MLSSVLRSPRAIAINIQVVRTFVQLRQWLISNRQLGERVAALEQKVDGQFKALYAAIEALMAPPARSKKPPIGFR